MHENRSWARSIEGLESCSAAWDTLPGLGPHPRRPHLGGVLIFFILILSKRSACPSYHKFTFIFPRMCAPICAVPAFRGLVGFCEEHCASVEVSPSTSWVTTHQKNLCLVAPDLQENCLPLRCGPWSWSAGFRNIDCCAECRGNRNALERRYLTLHPCINGSK